MRRPRRRRERRRPRDPRRSSCRELSAAATGVLERYRVRGPDPRRPRRVRSRRFPCAGRFAPRRPSLAWRYVRMAVDVRELSPEDLRDQTLGWLQEQLPDGWIAAVDAGDDAAFAAARAGLEYSEWCVRF